MISGADRGRVYRELTTPITIGREEGNVVQLNDERISRYHVKIQEDDGRLVITDLDSTNGTRINGHVCSLKILRYGDTISVGRTVLLVGTREQVADCFEADGSGGNSRVMAGIPLGGEEHEEHDIDMSTGLVQPRSAHLASQGPQLPRGLSPGQAAELRELLDHLHNGMQLVVENASANEKENSTTIDLRAWQNFLMTQGQLAELIHAIEDPQGNDTHTE
ncbi:MAG: FHA domain-containing protein [Planctomycetales bacterium]|nr:FHA domain-containing protein [Planctomycetales bacterium]